MLNALKAELEELRNVRDLQAVEIAKLREEVRELRRRLGLAGGEMPSLGLKLALVAPSFRKNDYLMVLEDLGLKVTFFASEDKIGQITHGCSRAHGILYVTTYTSHAVDAHLDALADRTGLPLRKLPFKGLDRLRETAIEMIPDMQAYKELLQETRGRA